MLDPARIMERCDALARHSELPGGLTRVFLSPEARAATDKVLGWMREAGMQASLDAIGNAAGRYEGERPGLPALMLGSHLDTVRDAGKYDGMLGVVSAIECVGFLNSKKKRLPFAIEVIGFGDEEGVRFGTTLLGSRAVAGIFDPRTLEAKDQGGKPMRDALRDFGLPPEHIAQIARKKAQVLAYAELHIEQGPVLESEGLPVGVVTAINGFSRLRATLRGAAGHAGTVPMNARRDALAAAAEWILAVESVARRRQGTVATVGQLTVDPGARNVIPGEARMTLDVRHTSNAVRREAIADLRAEAQRIATGREVELDWDARGETAAVPTSPDLTDLLADAVEAAGHAPERLPSGAGHDAVSMATLTDIAMLFVRCERGISHNPAEAVAEADVAVALDVLERFLGELA